MTVYRFVMLMCGRKPRAARAAGRVVNLGHRLVVVAGGKR